MNSDRITLQGKALAGSEDSLDPVQALDDLVEAIERHPGSRVQLRLRTGASFPVGRHYRRRLDEIRATA